MIGRIVCSPSFYEWLKSVTERVTTDRGFTFGVPVEVDDDLLDGVAQVYDTDDQLVKHIVLEGDHAFVLDVEGLAP